MSPVDDDIWITISELRTHMHRVLREVERGRTFRTTRSGREAARLVAFAPHVDEFNLEGLIDDEQLPLPPEWQTTISGKPMPNVVRAIRGSRAGR